MSIGNCLSFTLEVNTNGAAKRDPKDYVDKRSAEKRPGSYGGEFLRFSRREAAHEVGRAARRLSPEDSRAHDQSSRSGAFRILHLFRRETCPGARCSVALISEKSDSKSTHQTISRALLAQDHLLGDVARISPCAGVAHRDQGSRDRGVSHPDDHDELYQRRDYRS